MAATAATRMNDDDAPLGCHGPADTATGAGNGRGGGHVEVTQVVEMGARGNVRDTVVTVEGADEVPGTRKEVERHG